MYLASGINIVIDGQWGSTGKGKLCAFLGKECKPDFLCSSFGPNAGHTYVSDSGEKVIYKHLPSSACTCQSPVLILPDSVVSYDRLMQEAKDNLARVVIHPLCAVVTPEDKERAQETGRHIAGTMQGTGHAIARKLLRIEGLRLARDVFPKSMIGDTSQILQHACRAGQTVLLEVSQGFDLSLNHGHAYPYCTSRDISVGCALNASGCSHKHLGKVIGSIRCHPIRVGNVEGGHSGPWYPDQEELNWSKITVASGSPVALEEKTTVTGRVRRVFSFSTMQLRKFADFCAPDWLFLNFVQYIDYKANQVRTWDALPQPVQNFVRSVEEISGSRVLLIGTGASDSDVVRR